MKKLVVWMFLAAAGPLAAAAPFEDDYRGNGYVQFGIGGCTVGMKDWFSTGCGAVVSSVIGGGEAFVYRGLAVGAEGGWGWSNGDFREGLGVVSVNPAYHFKAPGRALVPFVSGGYTALIRDGHLNGFNVGGGATWWGRHVGLRFEGRIHRFSAGPVGVNIYMFGIGPAFR